MKLVNRSFCWNFLGAGTASTYRGIWIMSDLDREGLTHERELVGALFPDLQVKDSGVMPALDIIDARVTLVEMHVKIGDKRSDIVRFTPDFDIPENYILIKEDSDNMAWELHGSYDNPVFVARLIELGFEVIPEE